MSSALPIARTDAEHHYSAFGIALQSAVEIPGLHRIDTPGSSPYRIRFRPVSRRVEGPASPATGYAVRHDQHGCAVRFADGSAAEIDMRERVVIVEAIEGASFEDAAAYLTGAVVGMLARLEGRACFHGAVVVIDGEAHVLCGPSESGKSTTAAAFARHGFDVMSDDTCAVEGSGNMMRVHPANPRVNLWPEGAAMVFGPDHELPPISPPWPKLYLDLLELDRFESEPTPLGAVWILALGIDSVEPLSGSSCLTNLVANAYLPDHCTPDMRTRVFEVATSISRTLPVRLLPAELNPKARVDTIVREHRAPASRR